MPGLNGTPNQAETLPRYVEFMVTQLGARPHWGQRPTLSPSQLRTISGDPAVDTFARVRRQLDPLGASDHPLTRELGL